MRAYELKSQSLKETKEIAGRIAKQIRAGDVLCLMGDLGAGKTYFTKFLAGALGIAEDEVMSPTFVYWKRYQGEKLAVHHFDFYRIDTNLAEEDLGSQLENIGIMEAFADDAVCIIEWADKIQTFLPEERIEIRIHQDGDQERTFEFTLIGKRYKTFRLDL